jgi:hypothetical protein
VADAHAPNQVPAPGLKGQQASAARADDKSANFKGKVIIMHKRRRTWRDYKEMEDNWSWEKLGRNPDGTPHQSYAPEMPPDPYPSPHKKPIWGPPEDRYEPYDGN